MMMMNYSVLVDEHEICIMACYGPMFCLQLNHSLERCMAQVNRHLLRHKIILGLDDRGKLSCHKVNLCFIYFDTMECIVSSLIL
jgi:hypothetical protein